MLNRSIIFAALILALTACGDKTESDSSKAMERFMSEQQKLLEQAKAVGEAATEVIEEQKKKFEEMKDK